MNCWDRRIVGKLNSISSSCRCSIARKRCFGFVGAMDTRAGALLCRLLFRGHPDVAFRVWRKRLEIAADGWRHRLAHPHRRIHPGESCRADSRSVLVLETGRALVCLGMAFRRCVRTLVPLGRAKGDRAFLGSSDCHIRHRAAALRDLARRQCTGRSRGNIPGNWQRFATFSGAAAFIYFAVVAGLPLAGGSGSPQQHALDLAACSCDRCVDEFAWRVPGLLGVAGPVGARKCS